MRVNLSFRQAMGGQLLVVTEAGGGDAPPGSNRFWTSVFEDENIFLESVVFAELASSATTEVIVAVLKAMQPSRTGSWVSADLSVKQLIDLGLGDPAERLLGSASLRAADESNLRLRNEGFAEALLRSTTPIAVAMGVEHTIAAMNDAYAQILGREHAATLVGKPVHDALPELRGHSCLESLTEVYRSGESKIGIEVERKLRRDESNPAQKMFFELSYNPVRDHDNRVCGVLVLATDVTGKVLDRQVSAFREAQLYRQWAELETIYRTAPLAMCYFDAKEYRIIRANRIQAETMGAPAEELVGKSVLEIFPDMKGLREIFERVANGESINNLAFTTDFPSAPGVYRNWQLNYSPVFDAFGRVDMITSIAMEVPSGSTGNANSFQSDAQRVCPSDESDDKKLQESAKEGSHLRV